MFSGLLQKDLFKGGWSLAEECFKQNCDTCHTTFTVFFPLTSYCVKAHIVNGQFLADLVKEAGIAKEAWERVSGAGPIQL